VDDGCWQQQQQQEAGSGVVPVPQHDGSTAHPATPLGHNPRCKTASHCDPLDALSQAKALRANAQMLVLLVVASSAGRATVHERLFGVLPSLTIWCLPYLLVPVVPVSHVELWAPMSALLGALNQVRVAAQAPSDCCTKHHIQRLPPPLHGHLV